MSMCKEGGWRSIITSIKYGRCLRRKFYRRAAIHVVVGRRMEMKDPKIGRREWAHRQSKHRIGLVDFAKSQTLG